MREPEPNARLYWHSGGAILRRAFAEPPPGAAFGNLICAEPVDYATAQLLFMATVTAKGPLADRARRDLARALDDVRAWRRCAGWAEPALADRSIDITNGDD